MFRLPLSWLFLDHHSDGSWLKETNLGSFSNFLLFFWLLLQLFLFLDVHRKHLVFLLFAQHPTAVERKNYKLIADCQTLMNNSHHKDAQADSLSDSQNIERRRAVKYDEAGMKAERTEG